MALGGNRRWAVAITTVLAIVASSRPSDAYTATVGSYSATSSTTLSAPLVVTNGTSSTFVMLAHDFSYFRTSILVGYPGFSPATYDLGALEIGSAFDAAMTSDGKVVIAYERRSYTPARVYAVVVTGSTFGSAAWIDVASGSAASTPRVVAVGSGGAIATFVQSQNSSATLYSAEYSQGSWRSTTTVADLGTSGTVGAATVDVASGGGAAIAVFPKAVAANVAATGSSTTTLRAHAARWNGAWGAATQIDGAAGAGSVAGASVAMNSAGDGVAAVRLANGSSSSVAAARYVSGWAGAAIVASGDISGVPRVGVATNGNAQIAFLESALGHTVLRASRFDGVAWSAAAAIDGPYDTSAFDLAVAADGVAWVVYRGGDFYVNRFDGASWKGYEYLYSGTSAGAPSAAIYGTNGLIGAWSAGGTMRVASVSVATATLTDAGGTGDATAGGSGGSGSSGSGTGGGTSAAAPPSPGEGNSADAGATSARTSEGDAGADAGAAAGAVAVADAGSGAAAGTDAGFASLAPTATSSEPYDAGKATVSTSARCTTNANCSAGEACDTSVGVCVAATASASVSSSYSAVCQADIDCPSGSACVSGQCVVTTDLFRGCGCSVDGTSAASSLAPLVVAFLVVLAIARLRRRQGVKPRP